MPVIHEVSIDELRKCLAADFPAGLLLWTDRPASQFATENGFKVYHAQFPGTPALANRGASGCHGTLTLAGKKFYLSRSRTLWALKHGAWPKAAIGHKNLDPYDDRFDNLVEWTPAQQSAFSRRTTGETGVKGVNPTRSGKFTAAAYHLGRQNYVGTFETIEEARIARNAAAIRLHGEFARIAEPQAEAAS